MALVSLALAVWIAFAGPSFISVALYCAAYGFVSGFRTPAYNATMPMLVPERHLVRIVTVAAFVVGAGALVSGLIPEDGYWVFVACIGILAIACAWFNAPLMTLLQKRVSDDKLGRVMGLFTALNGLAIPAGTALGGAVAEITGTPMFFCIDGVFIVMLGVLLAFSKNVRKLDEDQCASPPLPRL